MSAWVGLTISFVAGSVLGAVLASLRLKSKLKLYTQFIESRLGSSGLLRSSKISTRSIPKSTLWETPSESRPKPREKKRHRQNK